MIQLDVKQITAAFNGFGSVDIHYFDSLPSTNTHALGQMSVFDCWQLYMAESQTAGRGRLGRVWHSPAYENIYLSLSKTMFLSMNRQRHIAALSLVAALSIVTVLNALLPAIHWQVKWPNDIWGNGHKVAGLLLESQKVGHLTQLVLGVGLNVNSTDFSEVKRIPAASSLALLAGHVQDRTMVIIALIKQLMTDSEQFFKEGLSTFQARWQAVDALYGQALSVTTAKGQETGVACGIDSDGQLAIERTDGSRLSCSVGEVTLLMHQPL